MNKQDVHFFLHHSVRFGPEATDLIDVHSSTSRPGGGCNINSLKRVELVSFEPTA